MKEFLNIAQRLALFLVLGCILFRCADKDEDAIKKYFDLNYFIDQQITTLQDRNVQLTKTLKFGQSIETRTMSNLDSSQWEKELKIFREHDINKPVLIDAYVSEEGETLKGQSTKSYKLTKESQMGVLDMAIIYGDEGKVIDLSSSFQEQNLLYRNFRNVAITVGPEGGLTGYEIAGYHKLLFKDTVHYQIVVEMSNSD
jgi:hypothetical protein